MLHDVLVAAARKVFPFGVNFSNSPGSNAHPIMTCHLVEVFLLHLNSLQGTQSLRTAWPCRIHRVSIPNRPMKCGDCGNSFFFSKFSAFKVDTIQ